MQFNGTATTSRGQRSSDVEMADYPLNYGEITAAMYASDVPTGTHQLADLSAIVGAVVARLGLAEIAARSERLRLADLATAGDAVDNAYDGYDLARLDWARGQGLAGLLLKERPTVAVPLAFYDDVAALWAWRPAPTQDATSDHRHAAGAVRARVPAEQIEAARSRGLALAGRADTIACTADYRAMDALNRWTRTRCAMASGHPLLVPVRDATAG